METKYNFKSQPYSSIEQSERLLSLCLKKETADMHHWESEGKIYTYVGQCSDVNGIPAWSLDRLREILNKSGVTISFVERDTSIIVERYGVFQNVYEIWDNVYDNICDAIEWLIKKGFFNKEYLEE